MKKLLLSLIMLVFFVMLLTGCSKLFDEYYARPAFLEPPIYELLQKDGRFSIFLQCIDKTKYARILKSSSYYSVFAPTDSAFAFYLQETGNRSMVDSLADGTDSVRTIADISAEEADTIVAYSMVFNVYSFEELSDVLTNGWDTLASIKKKTAFYETLHRELYNGDSVWVIDAISPTTSTVGENNYKYVPTYLSAIFNKRNLSATDYETFYDREYTGENIQRASVVKKDMFAENGIVHAVDRVNKPLPNLENLMNAGSDYSEFVKILDRKNTGGEYIYKYYLESDLITQYYKDLYPEKNITHVYTKSYYRIPISPNTEKVGFTDKLAETTGYSLVIPTNTAIQKFYNEKIKPFAVRLGYTSIDNVPTTTLDFFLNSHMSGDLIWPSRFANSMNKNGEFFNGLGSDGKSFQEMNFSATKVASNGFLFALDDTTYIHPRQFETVYAQLLLDPAYSWMSAALSTYYGSSLMEELMRSKLNGYKSEYYIVLLMSNEALSRNGYTMSITDGIASFSNITAAAGMISAQERLKRLVQSCVFVRIKNETMDNSLKNFLTKGSTTSPTPCFTTYGYEVALNYFGDMVRFKCPTGAATSNPKKVQVQMLGKYDGVGASSYLVGARMNDLPFNNGVVYTLGTQDLLDYCNSPITWNENTLGYYLFDGTKGACTLNTNLSTFKSYALAVLFDYENSLYSNPVEIDESSVVTVLVPNNVAMAKAYTDGYLPALASLNTPENIQKARNFLLNHFLEGRVFVNDLNTDHVIYNHKESSFSTTVTNPTFYVSQQQSMMVDASKDANGCLQFQTSSSTSLVTGNPVKVVYTVGGTTATQAKSQTQSNIYARKGVIHEIDGYLPCVPIMK